MILPLLSILLAAATPLFSLPTQMSPTAQSVAMSSEVSTMPTTSLSTEEAFSKAPLTTTHDDDKEPSTTPLATTLDNEEASSTTPVTVTTTTTTETIDQIQIMNTSVPEIELTIEAEVQMMNVHSASDERFLDREVKWLVLEKTTHIDREEEFFYDVKTGNNKRKSSENRHEALKVLRDNRYGAFENELGFVKVFQM